MIRYLILSLFIHLAFVALMIYQPYDVIENPIYSVELFDSQTSAPAKSKESKVKQSSLPQASTQKQTENLKPSPSEESTQETSSSANQADESNVTDAQQVTKMPRVLKQIKAEYPESAKLARVEGAVRLAVVINPQGQVIDVTILDGPGYGLNETAQKALMNFQFSPAEKEGEKVSVKITYIYRFRLDSR